MIRRLAILGASGDLAARYLLPAVATLAERDELPDGFAVTGIARAGWDTDEFRERMNVALEHHAAATDPAARAATVEALQYGRADVTSTGDLRAALGAIDEPVAVYLSLPPRVTGPTIRALCQIGLPAGSRVAIEKPFGEDLESARRLNDLVHEAFPESAVFRVDHFLAEPAVQNLLCLRLANHLFEYAWHRDHIERVEITWDETLALEGRAGYYDAAGALRDMVQNHLLQLLCIVAMEPPIALGERDLRDRKLDVLRAVHRMTPDEVDALTVRGRYTRGRVREGEVPSYTEEEGVDPSRRTETFVRVDLRIDNWRWEGVPFVLRTGKALGRDRHEIAVHFRSVAHAAFDEGEAPPGNMLRLGFDPASVTLSLNVKGSGNAVAPRPVDFSRELPSDELPAYARVLRDLLRGESGLSVRDDEAEEAWRVVEPILKAWASGRAPLREYPAGSDGPEAG